VTASFGVEQLIMGNVKIDPAHYEPKRMDVEIPMDDPGGEPLPEDVKRKENAEAKIIAEGQKKLDAKRKGRSIKKDKIADVRESGFFKPMPKGEK